MCVSNLAYWRELKKENNRLFDYSFVCIRLNLFIDDGGLFFNFFFVNKFVREVSGSKLNNSKLIKINK